MGYYLKQLTNTQRCLYNLLVQAVYKHQDEVKINLNCNTKDVKQVINAIELIHPEFFYLGNRYVTETMNQRVVSVRFKYINGKSDIKVFEKALTRIDKQLKIKKNMNEWMIVKTIHDYLIQTVKYDKRAGLNIYSSFGALVEHKAVCSGIAKAFKLLCNRYNIVCSCISGKGKNEDHMWNIVKIKQSYYHIDVTWDINLSKKDRICYDYFLLNDAWIMQDHSHFPYIIKCNTMKDHYYVVNDMYCRNQRVLEQKLKEQLLNNQKYLLFKVEFAFDKAILHQYLCDYCFMIRDQNKLTFTQIKTTINETQRCIEISLSDKQTIWQRLWNSK